MGILAEKVKPKNYLKSIIRQLIFILNYIRFLPHICIMHIVKNKDIILADINRWSKIRNRNRRPISNFVSLLTSYKEFRTLFYYRVQPLGKLLAILAPPKTNLYLHTDEIGPGLFIQHGFSTTIGAQKLGKNCWINQQVTIGFSDATHHPTLGDNVKICAGAKVIGDVKLGNNSIVGANAVVVKDVPANCTVVGIPAYIIRKNGKPTREPLT